MQKYFSFFKKISGLFRRHSDDERSLMEKLRDKYRLVVMNDDSFEEVFSFKLTPLNVYIFFSSLIVGVAILMTLIFFYTPIKRYIPGYGDFTRDSEVASLTSKVKALESEAEANRAYADNIRKLLNGDVEDITQKEEKKSDKSEDALNDSIPQNVGRIPEEEMLRANVEKGAFMATQASAGPVDQIITKEKPLEQLFFIPPVSGEITAPFNYEKQHFGIDIASAKNTAVKAVSSGVVISAGMTIETGYSIAIQHANNVVTFYKHNSILLKKEGDPVRAGEAIAVVGNTGEQSTGPHLHFELWYRGRAVDPTDYINFN